MSEVLPLALQLPVSSLGSGRTLSLVKMMTVSALSGEEDDLEVLARLRALIKNGKPFTEPRQVALGSECGSVGCVPAMVKSRGPAGILSGLKLHLII